MAKLLQYRLAFQVGLQGLLIGVEAFDEAQRQIGKVSELALGYHGGPAAFDKNKRR